MRRMIAGLCGLVVFAILVMSYGPLSYAVSETAAGNKFCPVSGEKTGNFFVEHEGKRYGLCCPGCAKKFKANPEAYLSKLAEQEVAATGSPDSSEKEAHSHEGHTH